MTDELVTFLRARLNEDEAVAQQAATDFGESWEADEAMAAVRSNIGGDVVAEPLVPRAHIARYDPARVLAEVEVKRRIIALHQPRQVRSTGSGGGYIQDCQRCDQFPAQYPCGTMRALALPYANHPDYRAEWAA